jgi:hypothetical protein
LAPERLGRHLHAMFYGCLYCGLGGGGGAQGRNQAASGRKGLQLIEGHGWSSRLPVRRPVNSGSTWARRSSTRPRSRAVSTPSALHFRQVLHRQDLSNQSVAVDAGAVGVWMESVMADLRFVTGFSLLPRADWRCPQTGAIPDPGLLRTRRAETPGAASRRVV